MEKQGDLVQGTLDMLVLKALARGAKHGYAVAEWIHESSNDVLYVEEGALYPALHRLELGRGGVLAEDVRGDCASDANGVRGGNGSLEN
jgi:PadR family transcriptional regulator PadR